jgi:hypothetical protein
MWYQHIEWPAAWPALTGISAGIHALIACRGLPTLPGHGLHRGEGRPRVGEPRVRMRGVRDMQARHREGLVAGDGLLRARRLSPPLHLPSHAASGHRFRSRHRFKLPRRIASSQHALWQPELPVGFTHARPCNAALERLRSRLTSWRRSLMASRRRRYPRRYPRHPVPHSMSHMQVNSTSSTACTKPARCRTPCPSGALALRV